MTVSRVRHGTNKIFECYVEVKKFSPTDKRIVSCYPDTYTDTETLQSIPTFCFPLEEDAPKRPEEYFSFTFTNSLESLFTFGYCYECSAEDTVICIISYLPWHDFFHRLVQTLRNLRTTKYHAKFIKVLSTLHTMPVPKPGPFQIKAGDLTLNNFVPSQTEFVRIGPVTDSGSQNACNRNISMMFPKLPQRCLFMLYLALLYERRIILVSSSLDLLSASVYACRDLLYPIWWQHVFIPILPSKLIDYVAAPMPLLIGLHRSLENRAKKLWGDELVMVDLDQEEMQVPPSLLNEDLLHMPAEIQDSLKEGIKSLKKMYEVKEDSLKDKLSRMLCMSLVALIGNYRGSCRFQGGKFSFNESHFLESRPPGLRNVLSKLMRCQHFTEFIEERLEILQGKLPRDPYEDMMLHFYSSGSYKNYLSSWVNDEIVKHVRPEMAMLKGGKFLLQNTIQDISKPDMFSSKHTVELQARQTRTAPTKPIPWHEYKATLSKIPSFLTNPNIAPPSIDDKVFDLLMGEFMPARSPSVSKPMEPPRNPTTAPPPITTAPPPMSCAVPSVVPSPQPSPRPLRAEFPCALLDTPKIAKKKNSLRRNNNPLGARPSEPAVGQLISFDDEPSPLPDRHKSVSTVRYS